MNKKETQLKKLSEVRLSGTYYQATAEGNQVLIGYEINALAADGAEFFMNTNDALSYQDALEAWFNEQCFTLVKGV